MSWKTACRSFYYADAEEPDDIVLPPAETAHLCIDVQDYYNVVYCHVVKLDEASSFFTA